MASCSQLVMNAMPSMTAPHATVMAASWLRGPTLRMSKLAGSSKMM